MKKDNIINDLIDSLEFLGLTEGAKQLKSITNPTLNDVAVIINAEVTEKKNKRTTKLLRLAKIDQPRYFSHLLNIPERNLDIEYLEELMTLKFIEDGQNLTIWGPPGTGKSWLMTAFATSLCENGYKVRMLTFPMLCRILSKAKSRSTAFYESKIKYFAKFDVLCIDEFPNTDDYDPYVLQEFFNEMDFQKVRLIVCSQCIPENLMNLINPKSFAQSIAGRVCGRAKILKCQGPDLRFRRDLELD